MKVTKQDIEKAKKELTNAKKQGNAKRISFWQATFNIYKKNYKGE